MRARDRHLSSFVGRGDDSETRPDARDNHARRRPGVWSRRTLKREGYETIKPKIPIAGEPMIDAVVRSLSLDASDECVVVTNFDDAMDSDRFGVVRLPRATVGATETVALALEDASLTPNTSSLLLVDCDAIYHCDVVRKFKALESRPEVRAAVLCFEESAEEQRGEARGVFVRRVSRGRRSSDAPSRRSNASDRTPTRGVLVRERGGIPRDRERRGEEW